MLSLKRLLALMAITSLSVLTAALPASTENQAADAKQFAAREDAYRANNIGVALLEQFKHKEAAEEFRRALRVDPALKMARANLAIALYNLPDIEGALREAKAASEAMPEAAQPYYLLGLIARKQNRIEDAVAAFERVLRIDPRDTGANINLGQLYLQQGKYSEALAALRTALESEPYSVTATYNLARTLTRSGNREEGQRTMLQFQKLRESN